MGPHDADRVRAETLDRWDRVAPAWGRNAQRVRDWGMGVSMAMIDLLDLHPGQRVLDLAAGPGDTGFLAAELVAPGGTLICSDGAEGMLEVARARAQSLGIANVEFQPLQLEWIDLPAASVDAILCRWGLMFVLDPEASAREMRRILRPGGRVALAVWDVPEENPWATIPQQVMIELGFLDPPDPSVPGMFSLASAERLSELLAEAGFVEATVDEVELIRRTEDVDDYLAETTELSGMFGERWDTLDPQQRAQVRAQIAKLAAPYLQGPDGPLELPGRSLVVAASA